MLGFFAWNLFKSFILNEKFYPWMTTIGAFFSKLGNSFPIFKKGQGRPPPSSYRPGKIIPRYVLLFMHFPKRSNFQVSLLPTFFSSNSFFLKPNYFRSSYEKKHSRYYNFRFPEQGTHCYYAIVRSGE